MLVVQQFEETSSGPARLNPFGIVRARCHRPVTVRSPSRQSSPSYLSIIAFPRIPAGYAYYLRQSDWAIQMDVRDALTGPQQEST